MFYIRTDANPFIATGHVMRCISIAKEMSKLGEEVTFITADLQAQNIVESNGFSVVCLNSDWRYLESELDQLIALIQEKCIDKLLIDSYYVTEQYLKELRRFTKLIYIDDLASFIYPVDVLINYNNYAQNLGYESWADRTGTELVLGCKYAPLRSEFRDIHKEKRGNIKNVLLTTGGSDSNHVALKFLNYFYEQFYMVDNGVVKAKESYTDVIMSKLVVHVVIGKFSSDKEKLQNLKNIYPNIKLYMDITNMSDLMKMSDLVITAGGSTMYESCACGVPMITYSFADNQLPGVKGFEELGVAKYCGDIRDDEDLLWDNIIGSIKYHLHSPDLHEKISNHMKSLVDGYGARRLAKILIGNFS